MNKLITAMEPQRDQCGYWTHPDFFVPANDMDNPALGELEAWLEENRVIGYRQWMEDDTIDGVIAVLDASQWKPTSPEGDGWFMASIHDTEDGPVCYWLRPVEEELKIEFLAAHKACVDAAYAYFCACELGNKRNFAYEVYQRIRLAIKLITPSV